MAERFLGLEMLDMESISDVRASIASATALDSTQASNNSTIGNDEVQAAKFYTSIRGFRDAQAWYDTQETHAAVDFFMVK